jgi:DNA-binding transcriptional LysR family regulator
MMYGGAIVELRDLLSFGVLADELHFTRAADRLGVNPSTLTRRIRGLEQELGLPLLHRTSRRVALTDAGRELATRLPFALRQIDSALAAARATAEGGWEI